MSPHVGKVTPEHTHTHTPRSPDSPLTLTCKVQSLLHICVVSHTDTAAAAGTSSIFTTMSLPCYQLKQPAAAGEGRVGAAGNTSVLAVEFSYRKKRLRLMFPSVLYQKVVKKKPEHKNYILVFLKCRRKAANQMFDK